MSGTEKEGGAEGFLPANEVVRAAQAMIPEALTGGVFVIKETVMVDGHDQNRTTLFENPTDEVDHDQREIPDSIVLGYN